MWHACGDEKCIKHFDRKTQEKRPLEKLRCRCEDNIRMDMKEIGCEVAD